MTNVNFWVIVFSKAFMVMKPDLDDLSFYVKGTNLIKISPLLFKRDLQLKP